MMRNQPTDRFIHIDKLQLHYLEWGNEHSQTMVLLHGMGDNAHIWDHFARNAADHLRIIANKTNSIFFLQVTIEPPDLTVGGSRFLKARLVQNDLPPQIIISSIC